MMIRKATLLVFVFALAGSFACRRAADQEAAGVVPIKEALAAGRSPAEVGSPVPMPVSLAAPTFRVMVKNITDSALESVAWTAVAFDENGTPLPDGEVEGGYADPFSPIAAGETRELTFMLPVENAARVKLVLREVIYKAPNPLGEDFGDLAFKWTNPYHDAEMQKARGVAAPD